MGIGPSTPAGYQHIVGIGEASYDDDAPVSCMRAWATRNNLQHLIDQSSQVRVNWSSSNPVGLGDALGVLSSAPALWPFTFVHSWMHTQLPTGLYVRISGRVIGGDGDLDITARLLPADLPIGDTSGDFYWEATGTTDSTTSVALIEDIYYQTTGRARGYWRTFAIVEDGVTRNVSVPLARLDIRAETDDTDGAVLMAVTVREFI